MSTYAFLARSFRPNHILQKISAHLQSIIMHNLTGSTRPWVDRIPGFSGTTGTYSAIVYSVRSVLPLGFGATVRQAQTFVDSNGRYTDIQIRIHPLSL